MAIGNARAALILLVLGAAVGIPRDLEAQGQKTARVGRLSATSAETDAASMAAFRSRMRELGWVEGKNFTLVARYAEGRAARLPELAAELVRERFDVILAGSSPGALAAKRATGAIPIVMVTTGDPVVDGIVKSLARPDANVTGVTALGQALNTKRLELIKEAVPGARRVGMIINPASLYTARIFQDRERAARALALDVRLFEVREPDNLDAAFAAARTERMDALMVQTNALFITHRKRIVELAARNRVPAIYGEREFVHAGGLMFYGASLGDMYREAAVYVDKILRGAKPADLPIEQPAKLELVINLKAAKALGITIPPAILARADRIVEN
ncbi:MAG TPA: ABC transporter substrate-binding protein [Burkholderiales bacterium]|nr:ABC transporter substrate-binding protein [Burkholderiales bacterium]